MSIIAALALAGIGFAILAKSFHSKTAFVSMVWLIVIMSFLMAIHAFSFIGGIVITVIVSLVVIWLDEAGILV